MLNIEEFVEHLRELVVWYLVQHTGRTDWLVTARIDNFNYQFECRLDDFRRFAPSEQIGDT